MKLIDNSFQRRCLQAIVQAKRYRAREFLFMVWGNFCVYCDKRLSIDEDLDSDVTLDHVIPRCRGGEDRVYNYVPACRRCNSRRRDTAFGDFMRQSGRTDAEIQRAEDKILAARELYDVVEPTARTTSEQVHLVRDSLLRRSRGTWRVFVDDQEGIQAQGIEA